MAELRILLKCDGAERELWSAALRAQLPEASIGFWPEYELVEQVDYALLWQPDDDLLARLGGVKAIFSLGAGVDHLLRCPALPAGVPVVRLVDPLLTQGMTHYLLYQVLRIHRHMAAYEQQQADRIWRQHPQRPSSATRIAVLGYGELGRHAAAALRQQGFSVSAWARVARDEGAFACLSGEPALHELLANSEIVIALLPLTASTRRLIDARALARMPPASWLINVGRGDLIDEAALLQALDSGSLAGACLDVFSHEPLPAEHPFWSHARVSLTPHIASLTTPASAAAVIGGQIRAHLAGAALNHSVDLTRGY